MRVRLLGGFEVEGVAERELGSRKGRTLLNVLAVARGRPVSVDRLAEILWGDDQPARPAGQVGVLVSRLRGVIGSERITRTDAGYALAADWLDVEELATLAATSAEAMEADRLGAARAAAEAALALVRGPLLPHEDGPWVEAERAAVAAEVLRVRRLAVDAAVAAGDHNAAVALAEQALAGDPYDEVLLRALMEAHLAAGRPASALAAYARVRARLSEDLGVPPSAPTEALHARALAAADGDGPVSAGLAGGGAPAGIVGRVAELAQLDAALAGVSDDGAALVVIEGDAGIGKTTLVEAWAGRLGDQAVVLSGRCDELGRDLPLQPVTDALTEHLRRLGPERAAALVGDERTVLAPLLGPLASGSVTAVSDAEAARERLFAALIVVLARAEPGPTVLILEDLHLAGLGTLAWLAFARRRGQRTLLVVTTRPGGADALDPTRRLRLGPLDLDEVCELVGAERGGALYQRSGGHPLLLSALVDAPDDELPATLLDSVTDRVDSLGAEVGATLRVAAVLGHECDLELIALVLGAPMVAVLGRLETAARVGLIVERGSGFAFRHELIREALVAATGAARRALVHQQAARVLAGRPHPDPLAVAVHARAGGDRGLASSWLVVAATAAASRFDLDAAEEHLVAAIELAPTAEAFVARARVLMSRQVLAPAASDAAAAIALDGGAAALEVAGWIAYYQRRYEDARAYAEEAVVRAEADDAVRISALALAGRVRHGAGDLAGAVEHLTSVGAGPPSVRGVADVWLAQARNHQGRPTEALAALARPMVDPDALAHPWAPLHLRFNRILALGQLGRVADALRVVGELDLLVEREGAVGQRFKAPAANVGAWILRWAGRGDEADERNMAAVEATGGIDGPSADAHAEGHYVALLDLADGCALRGDWAGALALAERLEPVDAWTGTMAWHQRHRLGLLRARLALADGDADTAAALATAVTEDAAQRGAGRYQLLSRALTGLADPSVAAGELDRVIDGLGRCAVLDGWALVGALAKARASDAWRARAKGLAATMVGNAAEVADDARRLVDRQLDA